MTASEFKTEIANKSDDQLVGPCLRDDILPYVFEPAPAKWQAFRNEIASGLNVETTDIRIIGSARFGFSLKPSNNLKAYSDRSDIDVVIVNSRLFDTFWDELLVAAYPRGDIHQVLGGWLKERRNEVYTGWLTPLKITIDQHIFGAKAASVLQMKARWFTTLKKASGHPPRRHEEVNARLYRTWRFAELYHLEGLSALRSTLAN